VSNMKNEEQNSLEGGENVQQVLHDILAIRRSINSFEKNKNSQISETSFQANKYLQITTLIMGAVMIAIEIFGSGILSETLLTKNANQFWRIYGVVAIGIVLTLCMTILYFVIRRAAQTAQDDLQTYIKRNFTYLQNLSQVSDLFVKFVVISALIWGQKPEWIAPFLFLFTGDYLLQGRFFTLRIRISQVLAVISFVLAACAFAFAVPQVLWPLFWFVTVNILSLKHLLKLKRIED
jgi:hypothetical protein